MRQLAQLLQLLLVLLLILVVVVLLASNFTDNSHKHSNSLRPWLLLLAEALHTVFSVFLLWFLRFCCLGQIKIRCRHTGLIFYSWNPTYATYVLTVPTT